ncbi:MAG: hypothetical protein FRX48_08878 [Lasallia pustulata]|uniref:Phosphatidate phosphatase APP1 catalytic domain-containing protein n=1 Tax=Lasallia pustulata TaxID=136370 RepID=A0A5M8PEM4_9LECA|nr:MAG: hypothetical protein FRX48_08878 [Lasallia pustulata]
MLNTFVPLLLLLLSVALSSSATVESTAAVVPEQHLVTASQAAWEATKTNEPQRGIISVLAGDGWSTLNSLGSDVFSHERSGVLNFFRGYPTGDAVKRHLRLHDSQIAALPTKVLNLPGYGNWTDQGWNLRFHGNVYQQPHISKFKLDHLANLFLIGTSLRSLPPSQASQARNLTAEIFILQQGGRNVSFSLASAPTAGSSSEPGGYQTIKLPYLTTHEGDFDSFLPLTDTGLKSGNSTDQIQRLHVYAQGTDTGNATAYLVPLRGLTVISDIDDTLRVTRIYKPAEALLNTFARPFTPWLNMPSIYADWSARIPNLHFHYLTTTPEQVTRIYMDFIYKTYPGGSFDTRPLNFRDVSAALSIRKFLLRKVFRTYPQRKFILVGDTSNMDVMQDYPAMAREFPGQVQCIFLRNTSATDAKDRFPYDTSGFKGLDQKMYMFFRVPDDLTNLDIANRQCYNSSVPQNLTFGYQGLPFGIHTGSGKKGWLSRFLSAQHGG